MLPFDRIGNYSLIDKLGEGGMGEVYLAIEEPVGRKVAIKLMHAGLEKWCLQRFNNERKVLASLNQRNIVTMFASGEAHDRHYFVMEHLAGESLRERLRRGPIPPVEVAEITRQICDALNAAHRREIVHRDIKPDNIFLTHDDDGQLVKVLDFGIATLKESETRTLSGVVIGTGPYLSPEQSRGLTRHEIDGRADIYALGTVVYEMLTGELAFRAQDLNEYLQLHLYVMPPPPSKRRPETCSLAIDEVVMKALAKDPSQRHQGAREFARELKAAIESGHRPQPEEVTDGRRTRVLKPEVEGDRAPRSEEPSESKQSPNLDPEVLKQYLEEYSDSRPGEMIESRSAQVMNTQIIPTDPGPQPLTQPERRGAAMNTQALRPPVESAPGLKPRESSPGRPVPSLAPGVGAPMARSPRRSSRILLPVTVVLLVSMVSCGRWAYTLLTSPIGNLLTEHRPKSAVTPAEKTSSLDSTTLIGAWQTEVVEQGIRSKITWQANRDGTCNYLFVGAYGSITRTCRWELSDGILHEQITDETDEAADGELRWIDSNHFELTILDNGSADLKGAKRLYSRKL